MQRTIIYVDGFNLYYGCLKNTPYRWLDLKSLFSKMLNDSHKICKIKYFTALVVDRKGDEKSRYQKKLGLIFPDANPKRKPSRQLCQHADFIKHVRHTALANSQLPNNIPNSIITKPINW